MKKLESISKFSNNSISNKELSMLIGGAQTTWTPTKGGDYTVGTGIYAVTRHQCSDYTGSDGTVLHCDDNNNGGACDTLNKDSIH